MSNKSEEVVFDPTEVQLKALGELSLGTLPLGDLCNPTAVQLLLDQRRLDLMDLRALKRERDELLSANEKLKDERGDLRIKLARARERESALWIEIPVSFLGGFAINLITANLSPIDWNNVILGLVLLILSVAILLYLRMAQISEIFKKSGGREGNNA